MIANGKVATESGRKTCLVVRGPFAVPICARKNGREVDADKVSDFWKGCGAIAEQDGVYIFVMKAGRGFTPWYVGKAGRALKTEAFADSKVRRYNSTLLQSLGTPHLFFLTNATLTRRHIAHEVLKEIERTLIQAAKQENPKLLNDHHTRPVGWMINGVLHNSRGKPTKVAQQFKRLMGI